MLIDLKIVADSPEEIQEALLKLAAQYGPTSHTLAAPVAETPVPTARRTRTAPKAEPEAQPEAEPEVDTKKAEPADEGKTAAEAKIEAMGLLREYYGSSDTAPDKIKSLQAEFGVRKFSEIPDGLGHDLLKKAKALAFV